MPPDDTLRAAAQGRPSYTQQRTAVAALGTLLLTELNELNRPIVQYLPEYSTNDSPAHRSTGQSWGWTGGQSLPWTGDQLGERDQRPVEHDVPELQLQPKFAGSPPVHVGGLKFAPHPPAHVPADAIAAADVHRRVVHPQWSTPNVAEGRRSGTEESGGAGCWAGCCMSRAVGGKPMAPSISVRV
jgi:hypothetical protein